LLLTFFKLQAALHLASDFNRFKIFIVKNLQIHPMGNKGGKPTSANGQQQHSASPGKPSVRKRPQSPSLSFKKTADIKFAIRGASGTGKSTLVDRLTGRHFNPAYTPSIETTVHMHHMTFKLADEMTVAIYDCNDDFNEKNKSWYEICDVIAFVIDPRSKMSLEFVKAELPKVARVTGNKDVLIMINFKDLVTKDPGSVTLKMEDLRSLGAFGLKLTTFEVCLKDCYGLKTLQTVMNRPYIHQKLLSLKREMDELSEQLVGTEEEIKMYISNTNYEQYLSWLNAMQVPRGDDPKVGRRDSKVKVKSSLPASASTGRSPSTSSNKSITVNSAPKSKAKAKSKSTFSLFGSSGKKQQQKSQGIVKQHIATTATSNNSRNRVGSSRNTQDYMLNDDDDGDEGGLSDFLDDDANLDGFYGSEEEPSKQPKPTTGKRQQQQQQKEQPPSQTTATAPDLNMTTDSHEQEAEQTSPWSDQAIDNSFFTKEDNVAVVTNINNVSNVSNVSNNVENSETKGELSAAAKAAIAMAAQAAANANINTVQSFSHPIGNDDDSKGEEENSKKEKKEKKEKRKKTSKKKKKKKKKDNGSGSESFYDL